MLNFLNRLQCFFVEPTREFSVREYAKCISVAPPTAGVYLQELLDESILVCRSYRSAHLYKANLDSPSYCELKRYFLLSLLYESGLIDSLNRFYLKPTIILYGSSAHGLDIDNSDIDLLIISEKTSIFSETASFEKTLSRSLQLVVVKKFSDLKNKHLQQSVINGIVLQGELSF